MWIRPASKEHEKRKHIFSAAGPFAVSGTFAEILQRHDMGRNRLYPVKLFTEERRTPYEGEYFFPNLGEQKSGFAPERSKNFEDDLTNDKAMLQDPKHGNIGVTANVLPGVDEWMDPTFFNATFSVSASAEALNRAKDVP